MAGNVLKTTGPLSYEVGLQSGIVVRRHIDNIRGRKSPSSPLSDEDQPEADSSSQTDPAADDLVDPLTLPDLPTDPVNPPETHGVLPVPSPPNPTAPETQDPPRQDPPPPRQNPPPPPPPPQSGPPRRSKRYPPSIRKSLRPKVKPDYLRL